MDHYADSGYRYDVEDVLRDVKKTIDKLHRTIPVLVWSNVDGTCHPESDLAAYDEGALKRLWPDAGQNDERATA